MSTETAQAKRMARRGLWARWRTLGGLWALQAALSWLVLALWFWLSSDVNGPAGRAYGSLRSSELLQGASDNGFWMVWGVAIAAITVLQGLLLLPVRRPAIAEVPGWSLRASMAAAALGACALLGAAVGGVFCVAQLLGYDPKWSSDEFTTVFYACFAACWLIATPLLIAFARRRLYKGDRIETVLATVSARLFIGTVVETVAIIPVDVMARRKTDCYCGMGTFVSLLLCMSVGVLSLGPAVFLPILARRRKRWYGARCDCCGYDMSALVGVDRVIDRCPECGAGWRGE